MERHIALVGSQTHAVVLGQGPGGVVAQRRLEPHPTRKGLPVEPHVDRRIVALRPDLDQGLVAAAVDQTTRPPERRIMEGHDVLAVNSLQAPELSGRRAEVQRAHPRDYGESDRHRVGPERARELGH